MARIRLDLKSWLKRGLGWIQHKMRVLAAVSYHIVKALRSRIREITAQAGEETSILVLRLIVSRRLHISER